MKSYLILLIALLGFGTMASGQAAKFQALYLYQFAKCTSWPKEDSDKPFIITVIGDNDLVEQLRSTTQGKKVGSREIDIVAASSPRNLPKSDIIFLSERQSSKIGTLLSDQAGKKVLIVSGSQGLCSQGAAISFVENSGKLVYDINEGNINRRGLKVTPKLVSLARQAL